MAKKGFDLEKVVDGFLSQPAEAPEQTEDQEAEAPRAKKQKGKDVVVSFRLDEAVVNRFNDYAFMNKVSKKEALQTIITEYLDGRGLDEVDREILERLKGIHAADKKQAKE
nr:MAG TPA: repressor [Caudoviricetes sp.]